MEQLLPWVERELREFRRDSADLAGRYPRVAGRMGGNARAALDVLRDPHVDRLVQAVAVLHARIAHSLDRSSPLLDEALLGSLFPGLLRPFPSGAVFRLPGDAAAGTELRARGADGRCYRFRLCADAAGAGLQVAGLDWRPYAGSGQAHLLSLTLAGRADVTRLRLYVNAEPVLRAALQDMLLMRASQAWVSVGADAFVPLAEVPVRVAGVGEVGEHGWQVLRTWQCFPERFNFLELDLEALRRHLPRGADQVTLHLAVPVRADSALARTLSRVEASNLLTGCAPAANEFPAAAAPIDVTGRAMEYGLSPADASHVICSIDSVHLLRGRALSQLSPPTALRFGVPPDQASAAGSVAETHWTARRALPGEPGAPMRITFAAASGPGATQTEGVPRAGNPEPDAAALDGAAPLRGANAASAAAADSAPGALEAKSAAGKSGDRATQVGEVHAAGGDSAARTARGGEMTAARGEAADRGAWAGRVEAAGGQSADRAALVGKVDAAGGDSADRTVRVGDVVAVRGETADRGARSGRVEAAGGGAVTASVGLTCCDRAVPAGIVAVEPQGTLVSAVSRLREVEGGEALRWRLLAMLALEARPPDLESLRMALSLQDLSGSEAAGTLRDALVDVQTARATLALRHKHGAARVDGTEVRVTLDERALVGTSVAVFAHVIDQYLSHSVHLNTFMQLVVISAETGGELMRCRPRNGNLML
ncbi:MAG TPA: type VI secretion system baseplate subunit TssF [Pseudoduganella sp.]